MSSLSRRQILQSLLGAAGLSAVSLSQGCSSGQADGDGDPSEDELRTRDEALKGVDKIVVLMMENRSFDHVFGHLTIAKEQGGEGFARFDPTKDKQVEGDRRVNGLTGSEWNPKEPGANESNGVRVFHATPKLGRSIGDINHEFYECHNQWNQIMDNARPTGRGRMDGFVIEHLRDRGELQFSGQWAGAKSFELTRCGGYIDLCANDSIKPGRQMCGGTLNMIQPSAKNLAACGHPDAPMAYYKREDTPVYHAFLDNYTLCDAWHASVMGPTWPNRFYVHGATSGGAVSSSPRAKLDTIWKVLKDAGLDAMNFFADIPLNYAMYGRDDTVDYSNPNGGSALVFDGASPLRQLFKIDGANRALADTAQSRARDKTFEKRCQDGDLPPVSFIEPPYFSADDHPPHDIHLGQAFVKAVYSMLYGSKANRDQANKTLFVILYDEHGAFYDHQDPGVAADKSSGPMDSDTKFRALGFRVPAMIVGPMVKRAHVSHTVYDHTSVLTTILKWARLKGRNVRDFQPVTYDGVTYDPNRRIKVASDIGDCLDLDYDGKGREMIKLPGIDVKEVDVLATMMFNEGQKGFADTFRVSQPSVAEKMDAAKVVMEHLYRMGAVNVG